MIERKHKGGRNELLPACWLLDNGYEVFRNVSQHGYADIVALRDGKVLLLDVKSALVGADNGARISPEQIRHQVHLLLVYPNGIFEIVSPPSEPKPDKLCENCGAVISRARAIRFCSKSCSNAAHRP